MFLILPLPTKRTVFHSKYIHSMLPNIPRNPLQAQREEPRGRHGKRGGDGVLLRRRGGGGWEEGWRRLGFRLPPMSAPRERHGALGRRGGRGQSPEDPSSAGIGVFIQMDNDKSRLQPSLCLGSIPSCVYTSTGCKFSVFFLPPS
jgi:hypothetical protein